MQGAEPAAGVLYLVGTPIGNTGDLSPRARTVLAGADRIACEDTRRSGLLLHNLGIKNRLISFHEHNQAARIPELLEALEAGESVAVISDAGLPGISDPGEALVAAARAHGRTVICVPGPCAATTALVSSGLPAGRFCFEGFLPPKASQRRSAIAALASETRTIVLFEAPHRLLQPVAVTRELTKRHEQQVGPTLSAALEHFQQTPPQGEFTLVLGGAAAQSQERPSDMELRSELEDLVAAGLSRNDAARQLARSTGLSKRDLYALLHQSEDAR